MRFSCSDGVSTSGVLYVVVWVSGLVVSVAVVLDASGALPSFEGVVC